MLAKSHVGIGFLGGLLLRGSMMMDSGAALLLLVIFTLFPRAVRYILLIALTTISVMMPGKIPQMAAPLALLAGCLFPDIDHPNSTGSVFIAPTEKVLRLMVIVAGVVTAYLTYPSIWGISAGVFLVISAVMNLKWLPSEKLQRLMLIGGGLVLLYLNTGMIGNILGIVYVGMGILSHRGLTHSTEGLLLAAIGVWILASKTGSHQIATPFIVGYLLHLLADMISDSGIYLTYIGKVKYGLPLVKTSGMVDRIIGIVVTILALILTIPGLEVTEKLLKAVQ